MKINFIKTTLLTFLVVLASLIEAQNYIYVGSKNYPSTPTFNFYNPNNSNYPELIIAKHSDGGYAMFSVGTMAKEFYIKGTLFLFLDDGSIIKCTDKGKRDYVDNKSINLYNLTNEEINLLKFYRIIKIRYSINEPTGIENYTAENNKSDYLSGISGVYKTEIEVSELFR